MNILAIGDIFGRPGRRAFRELLPKLIDEHRADFVVANAENASGGRGLNPKAADELFQSPVHVLTGGNHIWEYDAIFPYLETKPILRAANVTEKKPGKGWLVAPTKNGVRVAVISLQGVVFMDGKGPKMEKPFCIADDVLQKIGRSADIVVVDIHAEATSEKKVLAWYLDGRVGAVWGTHTHVQTADEEILPGGTAFISDLGMTGPHASVVGLDKDVAIERFLTDNKKRFEVAQGGVRVEGVCITFDESTGKATAIKRIQERMHEVV